MGVGIGRVIAKVGTRPVVEQFVASSPTTRWLRSRFTNADSAEAVERARLLSDVGVLSTLHLRQGPVQWSSDAESFIWQTEMLVHRVRAAGIEGADISVKMEQLGYHIGGVPLAVANLTRILQQATRAGVTVTLDMEHPVEVSDTLQTWSSVQPDFPELGIAIQAYLPRSEEDCADLAKQGARVRLCKGGYQTPGDGSFSTRPEIDRAFVRCARELAAGGGYPMFATQDPRLWRIAAFLARDAGRGRDDWEMQTLQGVAPALVVGGVAGGVQVRCYLPFGSQTYPWLLRRVTERPSNLLLLATPAAWGDPLAFTTPEDGTA